jgi:hypothetical protein
LQIDSPTPFDSPSTFNPDSLLRTLLNPPKHETIGLMDNLGMIATTLGLIAQTLGIIYTILQIIDATPKALEVVGKAWAWFTAPSVVRLNVFDTVHLGGTASSSATLSGTLTLRTSS